MATKIYNGAPFGTQTKRFDTSGVHPRNKIPGTFTQMPYDKKSTSDLRKQRDELVRKMGPGKYEPQVGDFRKNHVERRASGPGWARAVETERQAAMPHLLNRENWEERKALSRKLGPGSYDISDWLQVMDQKPRATRGVCETLDERFRDRRNMEVPGPGTYGEGGVPAAAKEAKAWKSCSNVGMLDAKSGVARSLPTVGSELGPGTYQMESLTDKLAKRVISDRGPYDVFSGDRNKPIKTGHYAAPNLANLGPGQYDIKSGVDDLTDRHHKKQGKFSKLTQYPGKPSERLGNVTLPLSRREQEQPGPGSYDPGRMSKPEGVNQPGFLISAKRDDRMAQKFFTRNFNPVGAGRYEVQKFHEARHRNGHKSVFDSKTGPLSRDQEKAFRERVRGKDIQLEDRVHMVAPEHPSQHLRRFTAYQLQTKNINRRVTTAA